MQRLRTQKRAAQAGGLLLFLASVWPLFWGLSVLTGMISYNWGGERSPRWFGPLVLLSVAAGLSAILVGRRLMAWGSR